MLRLLVSVRFQVSFTPLVGVLFTFPSRYLCTIGRQGVFRLRGWSPYVQTGFHVPRPTQGSSETLRLRGYHPLRPAFPDCSASFLMTTGLLRFRSPLLAESLLMSFPPGTEMFQFPGFASTPYVFRCRYPHGWVSPFGNPRINDCSHLPAAYRSVPRPSSPLGAKASTERSYRAQYIPPMPARRTKPHDASHQLTKLTNSASLIHSFVHDTTATHKALAHAHGRSRDQPIRFTCQTSRLPDQIPSGTHHQAANLLCSGTPSSEERRIAALNPPDLFFWRRSVSNRRPPACKAGALPLSYAPITRERNNHIIRP